MSKRIKGVVAVDSKVEIFDQKSLVQGYQELNQVTDEMKRKLNTMRQRKLTLLAEVRFLRRRYKYLMENQSPKRLKSQKSETKSQSIAKERIKNGREANLRNPILDFEYNHTKHIVKERIKSGKAANSRSPIPVLDLNQSKSVAKERIRSGKEANSRNPSLAFDLNQSKGVVKERIRSGKEVNYSNSAPVFDLNQSKGIMKERIRSGKEVNCSNSSLVFDLNQKARLYSGKEASFGNVSQAIDLNQREKIYSAKEAAMQNPPVVFDLNQISREEEEFLELGLEATPMAETPRKSTLIRCGNDEQHNDIKLSVCRNIGSSSSHAVKRKISWQDQVALRV